MVNRRRINSVQSIFLEYHPLSSNITHCQVPSRVTAWFHDSVGDIDFYQMSSESTILNESIIFIHINNPPMWVIMLTVFKSCPLSFGNSLIVNNKTECNSSPF